MAGIGEASAWKLMPWIGVMDITIGLLAMLWPCRALFAWAVAWEPLGMAGLVQITVFIAILAAGLVWLWLKGGLDWGPSREKNADLSQSLRKTSK